MSLYDPRNRKEIYYKGILDGDNSLPDPQTREELYLKAIAEAMPIITEATVQQSVGSSPTDVMSQKASRDTFATGADLVKISEVMPNLFKGSFNIVPSNNNQSVFGVITPKRYLTIITSSTDVTVSSIQTRTTSNAASETLGSNVFISSSIPFIAFMNPTANINRFRFVNPDVSATLYVRIIEIDELIKAFTNSQQMIRYGGDFVVNQLDGLTWTTGTGLANANTNIISSAPGYSTLAISVKKGDYIASTNSSGHPLSTSYASIARKVDYGTGTGFYGLVWGNGAYVFDRDCDVILCKNNTYLESFVWYSSAAYAQSEDTAVDKYSQYPVDVIKPKITAVSSADRVGYDDNYPKPITLLHYSDIHNSIYNAGNVGYFKLKYSGYIDDTILTGDMTGKSFLEYRPLYAQTGYNDILLAIGNHDVYDRTGTTTPYDAESGWATATEKYNTYFKPSIDNWGVTQPTGAETNGLCYYYKDYTRTTTDNTTYGLRLIVLDAMAYNSAQHTWLVSTLADARTNNLSVVIAEHFPPILGSGDIEGYDTPFMSKMTGMEFAYSTTRLSTSGNYATAAVDDFMTAGGTFICWICGHMHYDQIATLKAYPNQIYIAVGAANKSTVWQDMPRGTNDSTEDLFNLISFDLYNHTIKVCRIGTEFDDWYRHRGGLSIDYTTRELIYSW